jgi:hypothetical protein
MAELPISRQPACGHCGHEEHVIFACEDCPCPPHRPTGIYP